MKNLKILFTIMLLSTLLSCSKEEKKPIDESIYFDKDECEQSRGTCCDTDGRILVVPNKTYNYTYFNNTSDLSNPNYSINWEVLEGSIVLIGGQNTAEATFKFGEDFTNGKIRATGKVNDGCCECQSTIVISKL